MIGHYNCDGNVMSKPPGNKGMTNKRGLVGLNSLNAIPAEQIEDLRKGVFNVVKQNLPRVREVLAGTRKWDPQQTRIYLALLNKVMPELSQSYSETNITQSVDGLTQDQLRAIIASETARAGVPGMTIIDNSPININPNPPTMLDSPILPPMTPEEELEHIALTQDT